MRIILAPNTYRDGISAHGAAVAMAAGVQRALPNAEVILCPLADGGDGTLGVLSHLLNAKSLGVTVRDPLGRPVHAQWALSEDGQTAIIEMAEASGLRLVAAPDRDPFRSSTHGTGELILAALDAGARRIILGAGGSATIDAGSGALYALGARFYDETGNALRPEPVSLVNLARIDAEKLDPRLLTVELVVCGDVFTPLSSNATVYGKQKGVRLETAAALGQVVQKLGTLALARGYDIFQTPWLGAAGGLAGALAAYVGAKAVGGAGYIAEIAGLPHLLQGASLLLTGEGKLDGTSHQGKIPMFAATMAAEAGIPAVILAGQIDWESLSHLPDGISTFSIASQPGPLEAALAATERQLTLAAEQVARLYASTKGALDHGANH